MRIKNNYCRIQYQNILNNNSYIIAALSSVAKETNV